MQIYYMKATLILLSLFLTFKLMSQGSRNPFGEKIIGKEHPSGLDKIEATRSVSFDYQSDKINPYNDLHNFQKASYIGKLLSEANRELFSEVQQNIRIRASKQKSLDNERVFAYAWENSRTGMLSGVSWYDLTESEKAMHRESFFRFHDQRKNKSNASSILDKEVAKAWILSPTGSKSGVLWNDLTENERQFYKNKYLKFKSQQMNDQSLLASKYQPTIKQKVYEQAWNLSSARAKTGKNWHDLRSIEKSKFRKLYSQTKLLSRGETQLLASR
jgi:hypothetical protein